MNEDQKLEMQTAVELIAFEMADVKKRLLSLERSTRHEDVRKRVFRTAVVFGIMATLAMQYWGFTQILHRLGP